MRKPNQEEKLLIQVAIVCKPNKIFPKTKLEKLVSRSGGSARPLYQTFDYAGKSDALFL